ncbi:DUF4328 domain-containing protein [Nocardia beijingensis]|uniref:DUF4328 domain-containing protein n=1 Tax=Nocardia beijingensis TaxID=95162 RepID=UPI001896379F|nr:DUF4328 domain-containing protein [Nocardia beijingensis]MBF6465555.1 DUF4328 domain-containing protein [Nocardia beijingensis]
MSTVVQPCARCGARWAVQGAPMHWCPRCRGVLLSPAPIDAPADRRNYRWVARKPDQRGRRAQPSARPATQSRTPRYTQIPRWGLIDPPPQAGAAARRPFEKLTDSVTKLLIATAGVFGLAACAELARYAVLLRNRTRLIHPAVLFASDALVIGAGVLAIVFALLAAAAAAGRLIEVRRSAYAAVGRRDPRSPRALAFGSLVPVVNLLWPGVFLSEVAALRGDPRISRAVRIWWAGWVFGGLVAAAALLWRAADSLQAQADGVLFTAFADAVGAAVALLTLWVLRTIEGRDLLGRHRTARRWLIAVDPAVPVIEPVHPGGRRTAAEPVDAEPAHEDNGAEDREQEEVMAK